MCGIVGQISFDKNINASFVKEGLRLTSHRGKDCSNIIQTEFVALGHNLLSITGDQTVQPVSSYDNTVFAVVNGEFYEYEKLKQELNFDYKTNSDSELIIHLYKSGLLFNYLKSGKLNGEFSFFIYDKTTNKAILGRDSFGIKPLYLYRDNERVYVSSEIKAFLALHKLSFDEMSLYSVLSMQYHDTYNTLFSEVKQIQPGTILTIDVSKRTFYEIQYFNQEYSENNNTLEENKVLLLSHLKDSVKRRVINSKKTGITLSGGIDSASILALSSEFSPNLNAYTISFKDGNDYDEYKAAEEMANLYSSQFNPIEVDETILFNNLENAIYHSEQVSINMHVASKYLLFKKMSEDGCKVSLSGEGSDEILFGYPHFKMDLDFSNVMQTNSYLSGMQVPDKDMLSTSEIQRFLGFVPTFMKAKYSMGYKLHNYALKQDYINQYINYDPASYIIRLYELDKSVNPVFNSSILWSKICMSNYILNALGDKLEMAHTIEGRVPFLDRKFYDFAKTIPVNQKIFNGNEKYILKEAMKPYITDRIYNKQKHPFVAPPLFKWTNNTVVYEHLMDIIHSSSIVNSHYFDQIKILEMIENLKSGKLNAATFDPVIMMIFSLFYLDKHFCKV